MLEHILKGTPCKFHKKKEFTFLTCPRGFFFFFLILYNLYSNAFLYSSQSLENFQVYIWIKKSSYDMDIHGTCIQYHILKEAATYQTTGFFILFYTFFLFFAWLFLSLALTLSARLSRIFAFFNSYISRRFYFAKAARNMGKDRRPDRQTVCVKHRRQFQYRNSGQ